jgi:hypothetical protein
MDNAKLAWVKLKTGIVTDGGCKEPGSLIQMPADEAQRFVDKGYAEEADAPAKRK